MSTETGMNDRQKLKALNRLSGLTRTAEELIHGDTRSFGDVTVLLEAMQAFKEGKLAAFIRASKREPLKDIAAALGLEVRGVPFIPGDQRYLADRGIRYVGELYYVYFDPRGAQARETHERMMEVLADRFGLQPHLDPVGSGWQPSYWGDPSFMDELNTLILGRHPTSEAPEWTKEIPNTGRHRRQAIDYCGYRGVARRLHRSGVHYIGEVFRRGRLQHCPEGMRSTGGFEAIKVDLHEVGSRLWAGALLPRNWSPPDWEGDLWQAELATIAREEEEIKALFGARDEEVQIQTYARREEVARQRVEAARSLPSSELLDSPVDTVFAFSVRAASCLQNAGIETVRQLVAMTEGEALKTKNFGRKSLLEVKEALADHGFHLGMTAADF